MNAAVEIMTDIDKQLIVNHIADRYCSFTVKNGLNA